MDWMYKGVSGHVDREEYLTGRKIDKTFELIEKEENPNAPKDDEDNALINQLASQNYADNFYKNDYTAKMREDPLYVIRLKQQEHRKQLLQNPLKLKQIETILKSSLEKDKKKHKNKKKSKKHKNHKKSSKIRRDSSSSRESTPEKRSKKNLAKSEKSSHLRDSSKSSKTPHFSSSSSANERSHDNRDNYKKHEYNGSSGHKAERSHSSARFYSDHRNEKKLQERSSKQILSEEELKRKREIMMQNATWREETRADKLKRLKKEEARIEESSKSSSQAGAQFIKPLLTNIASSNSIEDSIRKKRFTSQKCAGSMDVNFARRN